jgi:general secretion pathway protein D
MTRLPADIAAHLARTIRCGVCVTLSLGVVSQAQEPAKITEPVLRPATSSPPVPPPAAIGARVGNGEARTAAPLPSEEKADQTIRWESLPASEALKLYSQLTGRTVIQNAQLAGVVTLTTQTPLTKSEAILAIESVLFANGIAVTPMGDKFVKAAANPAIAREGVQMLGADAELPEADRIVSTVIPLRYLDVSEPSLLQSLSQFIHQPGGTLLPLSRSNSLLIIDTAVIVKRIQELLAQLDQQVENRVQVYFYHLENAEATKVAAMLQALITGAQPTTPGAPRPPPRAPAAPATPTGPTEESIVAGKVLIQSDDRTNMLIVMSRPSNKEFFDVMIQALDSKTEPEIRFKSFQLSHAKADEVAELILALAGSGGQPTIQRAGSTRTERRRVGGTGLGTRRTSETTTPPQPQLPPIARAQPATQPGTQPGAGIEKPEFALSERARVIPDPRQGSILALGTANDLKLLEAIIPELDLTLAQVLIESVIVEVTLDNSTEFGVNLLQRQWQEGSTKGGGISSPTGISSNLLQKLNFLRDPSTFAASGVPSLSGLTYFLELGGLDLDVIVRAFASGSRVKVLQKPTVQSSQNQPAHIFVGETRPIVTATQTGFSSGDTTIPVRSSIEQFDIGVTLDITPNITPGGLVELQVEQSVEDVSGEVVIDGNLQPIVARRELTSLVSVQDQGVVALGGLIRNDKRKSESKVPVLGDLPILGMLFKQTRWQDNRIELIVLLRPTVLRSAAAAQVEAQKMREKFKGLDNIPKDVLPPLPKEEAPEKRPWYAPFAPPKDKS